MKVDSKRIPGKFNMMQSLIEDELCLITSQHVVIDVYYIAEPQLGELIRSFVTSDKQSNQFCA